ncbi:MAG: transglycosylase SLT domain-containing protein [Acidobacteriia bacterium]|nr:transglycosylase SLT domain-containing protein [Terriglobia bacterium]
MAWAPVLAQSGQGSGKSGKPKAGACRAGCVPEAAALAAVTGPPAEAAQQELAELARGLNGGEAGAYKKLAAFATRNAGTDWGARAALALGYNDFTRNRHSEALGWFGKARQEKLLGDYVLFWSAQAHRNLGRNREAYEELRTVQRDYPNSSLREPVLHAFADTAILLGRPQEALTALDAYFGTASKAELLLLRARARQAAKQPARAAADYQTIYFNFPLSDEAKTAGTALSKLQRELRLEYPQPLPELQEKRAQAFFDAKKWREARAEYTRLLAQLPAGEASARRERANLRVAQLLAQRRSNADPVSKLVLNDPDVDAERMLVLAQIWRANKNGTRMLAALEDLRTKYPASRWVEDALMMEANFYWVQLYRERAAEYYRRIVENHPDSSLAATAAWRIIWVEYLKRNPATSGLMEAYLDKYPGSPYTVNAIYWMGRCAEREGNPEHARSFYNKAAGRYPMTYFGMAAAQRIEKIGPGTDNPAPFLDKIPPAPPLRPIDEPLPVAARERWLRAQALRVIGFDASAEMELKFAYYATSSPRLMAEAAQAAYEQGRFSTGMAYARLAVTNFEARAIGDLPIAVWKVLYPLPYEAAVRHEAAVNGLDPAFVAGLIRQESAFQANAVSSANALGLMQVLPMTAKLLAREAHVRYARKKLFEPEYNIKLGSLYIKGLLNRAGGPEQALAAYNAGEDRISSWSAERNYDEIAELVESIPFTETREYVQIVLRNAGAYRMIYGTGGEPAERGHLPVRE